MPPLLAIATLLLAAAGAAVRATEFADSLYLGGSIVTMERQQPIVEALAIRGGRVLALGSRQQLLRRAGPDTRIIDLAGRTLMPAFFDSHSHLAMTSAKLATVNLDPPPAGPADSIAAIQQSLRHRLEFSPPQDGQWLVGWGYDHAMLKERRHPTRSDLDAVSAEIPILLIHFSSHQVVVNSKGLALAGISADSADPPGGLISRRAGSREPDGILQENAMFPVAIPVINGLLSGADAGTRLQRGIALYASKGFTTVTEMAATAETLALFERLADAGRLEIDVIAAALSKAYPPEQVARLYSSDYRERFRVGGIKIVLDGGSPGRSAYLRKPYYRQFAGEADYRGYPHFNEQRALDQLLTASYRLGIPVYVHALGDAAVDQAIGALRQARAKVPAYDRVTQLIHVQQVQEDQLEELETLGAGISLQVAHNYYFGDFHREEIYGPQRTERLNPARAILDHGLSLSIHHDSPVHPVDQFLLIWAAVNRQTRSGRVIGPAQRITIEQALRASTIDAAYQFGEQDRKGSLSPGKVADLIILDRNPLLSEPQELKSIRVLETIKDGRSIFRRDEA